MEKRSADTILDALKIMVQSKKPIAKELWLEAAFDLVLLRIDEAKKLNEMRQIVAQKRLEILGAQEKRNVAAADVSVESLSLYREMKDQEEKMYAIDEFVRIAKLSSNNF